MPNELRQKIDDLLKQNGRVVFAVSGYGGSGKTTLAKRILDNFAERSVWIQLDNFLVDRGQGKGWTGGYDWDRLESVLRDVKAGKDLHYRGYDWAKDALTDWYIDEKLPEVIVVEGVRLFHPQLTPYFDLKVWIDRSLEESTNAGKERDRVDGSDGAHLKLWDDVWVPKEKEFTEKFDPKAQADYLYRF